MERTVEWAYNMGGRSHMLRRYRPRLDRFGQQPQRTDL